MCGIVGYVGSKPVVSVIINGLRKLEYRGYDSAGIAVVRDGQVRIRRTSGKLSNLVRSLESEPLSGDYGIGHTRWATHGRPTEENAHPHRDCSGKIVVVHNGIIENYLELKTNLQESNHRFMTETDTEVIAHLVESMLPGKTFPEAACAAMEQLRGSFAICMISADCPGTIFAARNGPPLIVGLGDQEYLVASDVPALLEHTRTMYFLKDGEMAVLSAKGVSIQDFQGRELKFEPQEVQWSPEMAEKGGFPHFMLKEIFEQPRSLRETIAGRVSLDSGEVLLDEANLPEDVLQKIERIHIVACGTSWHAALVGKFLIEDFARIPVEIDYGSEFRYRNPLVGTNTLVIAISQSGETADTLAAVREAKAKHARILSICNVVGSMLSRESDGNLYTRSGPEIGVASTKAFTSQLAVLVLIALYLARARKLISHEQMVPLLSELSRVPHCLEQLLDQDAAYGEIARDIVSCTNSLYLGRGIFYPIALEGALKLKEISYIHAEGYPAGEMKHGPNALIDQNLPVVVLATRDKHDPRSVLRYEKTISNIEEVRAREGIIVALASDDDYRMAELARHVIRIPEIADCMLPILMIVPLQLLAYHIAVLRGCDVDQPRNLAKSVTVE
ncbi:MAG TPA: glutamine--fructose-6-phosphate transaminase (isomerizing) [Acidobacteriota bacterium]|nr:glutamine--fructose-6-phosphate transaminase (isomerizing) [Acidobacteriota bacterium]